ncbi:hypothetical protein LOC67_26005 [Stieleria sp. JC731]|uniref:hypothetical protein n=1 Tax=Pirellulaceae TaxID=2691357 RepID=UPI001E33912E|nr:hypothetical protein [Stieleria sp. JC731]MCC9604022.1 hypothetical protein [Stieleria sp. JC731]
MRSFHFAVAIASLLAFACSFATPGRAQNTSPSEPDVSTGTASVSGQRHLTIVVGLPGDQVHRELMTDAAIKLIGRTEEQLSVASENLTVLAGDAEMQQTLSELHSNVSISTAESIEETLHHASERLTKNDAYWLIMIGHSHPQGVEAQFNVKDKDFHQVDFAKWADSIDCSEQVFWLTQPLSGLWIKPTAKSGRVVLTATEADLEFTATEMPYALADILAGENENQPLGDIDGDQKTTLLDLYLATCIEVTMRFRSIDRLQTEHGQLDDNSDGRGSEVQTPYLPPEPVEDETDDEETEEEEPTEDTETETSVGMAAKPDIIESRNLDGYRSRFILLKRD